MDNSTAFYGIDLNGVNVGGVDLDLTENSFGFNYGTGTMIDSGTTYTYFGKEIWERFEEKFEEYCEM